MVHSLSKGSSLGGSNRLTHNVTRLKRYVGDGHGTLAGRLGLKVALVVFLSLSSFSFVHEGRFRSMGLDFAPVRQFSNFSSLNTTHRQPAAWESSKDADVFPNYELTLPTGQHRRLELIHIPKTGGTVLEIEAARRNVPWGRCQFVNNPNIWQCAPINISRPDYTKFHRRMNPFCHMWHVPPGYFRYNYHPRSPNPYRNADLFAVVRNPYARTLSEYDWRATRVNVNWSDEYRNQPENLNRWIREILTTWSRRARKPDYKKNNPGNRDYHLNDCHMVPQYDYIYHQGEKIVPIVLRFENVRSDFEAMMKEYDMPFTTIPKEDIRRKKVPHKLTLSDISQENLRLIEDVYEADFREFGYKMLSNRTQQGKR